MRSRKRTGEKPGALIRKVRKPIPPPTKVEEDTTRYKRARERERLRRQQENEQGDGAPAPAPEQGQRGSKTVRRKRNDDTTG
jgi:hypothetical protein